MNSLAPCELERFATRGDWRSQLSRVVSPPPSTALESQLHSSMSDEGSPTFATNLPQPKPSPPAVMPEVSGSSPFHQLQRICCAPVTRQHAMHKGCCSSSHSTSLLQVC
ncbi:hypothetical protein HaLaN_12400 [Haematococcus lacustris]|uniref:Uncharacterized protein n=1 Tax=Haematococcus lacustris TaxID=44745 RepID=A0A699ZJX4_HAELA|nr:hypothetical protein HaLaN_12400 [Haematococcus lacustris]